MVHVSLKENDGFKRRGEGRGQHSEELFGKRALIGEGIMEAYLHQLSARLLGWRRSCDPPAIVLELPAGNNQSHYYSRSRPHQLNSWPEDQKLLTTASKGGSNKEFEEEASWKTMIGQRKRNKSFICI